MRLCDERHKGYAAIRSVLAHILLSSYDVMAGESVQRFPGDGGRWRNGQARTGRIDAADTPVAVKRARPRSVLIQNIDAGVPREHHDGRRARAAHARLQRQAAARVDLQPERAARVGRQRVDH